jgi:hypothetical protein
MRISGMSRSCGCTQITVDDRVILDQNIKVSREAKVVVPGQEVHIGVVLDTRNFVGSKSGEIVISFDQPSYADVRLTFNSFIRQDIVLNPGAILLGTVSRGQDATREVDVEYAGPVNWQILSVSKPNPFMDLKFEEIYRRPGQVGYKLIANLKASAPVGAIRDVIIVETNDPASPQFGVVVSGQVQPDLVVTPSNLTMGTVKPGQSVTRQVLVRGRKPFHVTGVEGGAASFQVDKPDGAQSFHRVIVRFAGSEEPGVRECTFKIQTDLADNSSAEFKAVVSVVR